MSHYDRLVLTNAAACALIFFLFQLIFFRFTQANKIMTWLMLTFGIGAGSNALISICVINLKTDLFRNLGFSGKWFFIVISLILYSTVFFLYVICVFGPCESSIRFRLVKELSQAHPAGKTLDDIFGHYNTKSILDRRLDRLIYSGEVAFDGQFYRYKNRCNIFSVFDFVTVLLKKMYGLK